MITGCSSKKETSIENCADENYVYDNSDSMTRIYYDINDKKIQGHSKGLEESIKKKENYSRQFTKWIKKNYNGIPEPKNKVSGGNSLTAIRNNLLMRFLSTAF